MLLCYQFFCFLQKCPTKTGSLNLWFGNRKDLLKWTLARALTLVTFPEHQLAGPSRSPNHIFAWEWARVINSRVVLCGQVKNYFWDLQSITCTLCMPAAGWSPDEDSQFRTFLLGSYCNINGCNVAIGHLKETLFSVQQFGFCICILLAIKKQCTFYASLIQDLN